MKTRLLIIIGIIMMITIPLATIVVLDRYSNYVEQLEYESEAKSKEPKPGERSYIEPELKAKLEGVELDLREKVRQLHQGLPPSSYAVNLDHQTKEIVVLVENESLNSEIKLIISQYPDDIPIVFTNGKISFGDSPISKFSNQQCADRFDQTKHEFQQSLEEYTCENPICPESEPPIFSSSLNSDEEFIEQGCAKFIDKWAYLTEDNDFTWRFVNWESFVKHHYESDPISDPLRNEKCAELFDLIYLSGKDFDLWYELTETNDFRDAKCASIVEEWEHLTEHDVWNIGISWKEVAVDAERKRK